MPPIPEVIAHYKRSIEQCGDDQSRQLHCIDKLFNLNVTVEHLKETGIGRTINKMRKDEGLVGNAARALVGKWKSMVADESDAPAPDSTLEQPAPSRMEPSYGYSLPAGDDADDYHQSHDTSNAKPAALTTSPEKQQQRSSSSSKTIKSSHNSSNGLEMSSGSSSSSSRKAHGSGSSSKSSSSSSGKSTSSSHHHSSSSSSSRDKSSSSISGSSSSSSHHHKSSRSSSSSNTNGGTSMPAPAIPIASTSSPTVKDRKSNGSGGGPPEKKHKSSRNVEEIDSSMGTSFADALGMMAPTSSKKSAGGSAAAQPKALSTSASSSSSLASSGRHSLGASSSNASASSSRSSSSSRQSSVQPSPSKSSSSSSSSSMSASAAAAASKTQQPMVYKKPTAPPSLLSSQVKLAPLDPEIAVAISNDYRPMPVSQTVMDCVYKATPSASALAMMPKTMTDAELGASMSSKNQRTKVYSGVKTGALLNVPTLHEMCIRVLQRNIEALEATGGVPFEILKPVLERATPEQLFTLEDYNPYLVEDTDDLWRHHCQRKFRTQKQHEYESWRDMFERCRDEQEKRLNSLTENIKRTQTVAVPLKQTKITFVDSVVKPPRDVLKKQARFDTGRVAVCTPAARVASLNQTTSNIARPGDARLRVMAGTRDHAQVSRPAARKAPLMAKTLQHMKGLFKR